MSRINLLCLFSNLKNLPSVVYSASLCSLSE
ncbi:hypothetical protein [Shigella phage ESh3]|nr:hypothetical protein [Shigella phage ESh3]